MTGQDIHSLKLTVFELLIIHTGEQHNRERENDYASHSHGLSKQNSDGDVIVGSTRWKSGSQLRGGRLSVKSDLDDRFPCTADRPIKLARKGQSWQWSQWTVWSTHLYFRLQLWWSTPSSMPSAMPSAMAAMPSMLTRLCAPMANHVGVSHSAGQPSPFEVRASLPRPHFSTCPAVFNSTWTTFKVKEQNSKKYHRRKYYLVVTHSLQLKATIIFIKRSRQSKVVTSRLRPRQEKHPW